MENYTSLIAQAIANTGKSDVASVPVVFDQKIPPPVCRNEDLPQIAKALRELNRHFNQHDADFAYVSIGGGNWSVHGITPNIQNPPIRTRVVLNGSLDKCRGMPPALLDGALHALLETGVFPKIYAHGRLIPLSIGHNCFGVVAVLDERYRTGHSTVFSVVLYLQFEEQIARDDLSDRFHTLLLSKGVK